MVLWVFKKKKIYMLLIDWFGVEWWEGVEMTTLFV